MSTNQGEEVLDKVCPHLFLSVTRLLTRNKFFYKNVIFLILESVFFRRYHNTNKLYFIYFIVYFRKQKFKEREILINFNLKKDLF